MGNPKARRVFFTRSSGTEIDTWGSQRGYLGTRGSWGDKSGRLTLRISGYHGRLGEFEFMSYAGPPWSPLSPWALPFFLLSPPSLPSLSHISIQNTPFSLHPLEFIYRITQSSRFSAVLKPIRPDESFISVFFQSAPVQRDPRASVALPSLWKRSGYIKKCFSSPLTPSETPPACSSRLEKFRTNSSRCFFVCMWRSRVTFNPELRASDFPFQIEP